MARGSPAGRGKSFWLQVLALLIAAAAVTVSIAHTNRQVERLRDDLRRFTRSYAELISAVATDTSTTSSRLDEAVSRLIARYDFPYVVTDTTGAPLSWRPMPEGAAADPAARERAATRAHAFDRQFEPIPLEMPGAVQIFHFGDPPSVRRLRLLPYILLGLLAVVFGLIWWSLRAGLERQRSLLWVGIARESAHQFGTPLSSLQGWMGLLRERLGGSGGDGAGRGDGVAGGSGAGTGDPETAGGAGEALTLEAIAAAMEEDVERLGRVVGRFGRIGNPVGEDEVDLEKVARRVVEYMRGRAPQRGGRVTFIETYHPAPPVHGSSELLEWVIENLLKNALDAIAGEGEITVGLEAGADGRSTVLRVEDNGTGIEASDARRIFQPGYSTRRRGWGLGLALARRLIEGYGGRIRLVRSRPGEGSIFEVVLPAARADRA